MLYKHDIEDRFDTICWEKSGFVSHTKRTAEATKHGSTSIMKDKHVTMNSRTKNRVRTLMQCISKQKLEKSLIFISIPHVAKDVWSLNQSFVHRLSKKNLSSSPCGEKLISFSFHLTYVKTILIVSLFNNTY